MTVDLFKNSVNAIVTDCIGIKMFFVDTNASLKDSDIDNQALTRLKTSVTAKLKTSIVENDSLTLPLLSNADDRKNALYEFDFDDKPLEFDLLDQALAQRINVTTTYNIGNGTFDDISAIIIVLTGRNNETITLYKHQYTVSVLHAEQGALNLFKRNNRLSELDSNILKIDPNFVFLKLADKFYVENVKTLETYLGFHDVIKHTATECVDALANLDLIEDITSMKQRVDSDDMAFSRKLAKVARNSPVMGQVENSDIIDFARKHNYLSKMLKLNDDGSKFVLTTKKSQNHFIKLMSDDYLESELTKIQYDSLAKDKILT
ncbi:DUF4868 domain-containing protein [Vibrio parahaemolyticus]|nr:DUF4868 domain-containing protein [Vibrio parahaemolyticus]MDF5046060.1 DUF4868 domain-containing protein [Vibrio parahaemolyticus]MDF5619372.1 DUF4868 domain-containing protein [Vibrio parahaemolyticus]